MSTTARTTSTLRTALQWSCVAAGALLLLACGPRDPGPSEDKWGKIFYWAVTGSDLAWGDECSDSDEIRGDLEAPEFGENTYVIYRVSDDGETAIAQSCETTDASTCSDNTDLGIVFDVRGNDLVYDPSQEINDIEGTTCDLGSDQIWTLTDEGETLSGVIALEFNHVGEAAACDPIETALEEQSDNGQGLDGCVMTISLTGEFDSAQAP